MEYEKENALSRINSFYSEEEECKKKKAEYFDKIAELFYDHNFGATTKSEIELLMFSIFMDEMIAHNQRDDGVLDYKECSDYKIGKLLGVPQQKVSTLKIKKQARYPQEFNWQKSFQSIAKSIVYDAEKKKVIIPVTDPNLYLAIRNFIEEHDGYIEIKRGNNVLQMRPEHFFNLLYLGVESEKEKQKIRKAFIKELKEKNETDDIGEIYTDKEVMDKALEIGDNVWEFFETVAESLDNPLLLMIKGIRTIGKVVSKR